MDMRVLAYSLVLAVVFSSLPADGQNNTDCMTVEYHDVAFYSNDNVSEVLFSPAFCSPYNDPWICFSEPSVGCFPSAANIFSKDDFIHVIIDPLERRCRKKFYDSIDQCINEIRGRFTGLFTQSSVKHAFELDYNYPFALHQYTASTTIQRPQVSFSSLLGDVVPVEVVSSQRALLPCTVLTIGVPNVSLSNINLDPTPCTDRRVQARLAPAIGLMIDGVSMPNHQPGTMNMINVTGVLRQSQPGDQLTSHLLTGLKNLNFSADTDALDLHMVRPNANTTFGVTYPKKTVALVASRVEGRIDNIKPPSGQGLVVWLDGSQPFKSDGSTWVNTASNWSWFDTSFPLVRLPALGESGRSLFESAECVPTDIDQQLNPKPSPSSTLQGTKHHQRDWIMFVYGLAAGLGVLLCLAIFQVWYHHHYGTKSKSA